MIVELAAGGGVTVLAIRVGSRGWDGEAQALLTQPEVSAQKVVLRYPSRLPSRWRRYPIGIAVIDRRGYASVAGVGDWLVVTKDGSVSILAHDALLTAYAPESPILEIEE